MALSLLVTRSGRMRFLPLLLGLLLLLNPACNTSPSPQTDAAKAPVSPGSVNQGALRKVRVLPYWVTTAQFAGYIIGKKQGIFEKYGIDLEILRFNPNISADSLLGSGKADFALLWLANALQMRDRGVRIVNIMQFSHRSSLMLLTKRSSGITSVRQMDGKKAAIWSGYEVQPMALFKQYRIRVEIIPIGSSNTLFLNDGVEIINANWFDEYHAILNSGYEERDINRFFFADHGLNFLEDGIYCLDSLAGTDPSLCAAFAEAARESWRYAFTHKDETIDEVMRLARMEKIPTNRSHQQWILDHYQELYIRKGDTAINTELSRSDYTRVSQILLSERLLNHATPYDSFVRNYRSLMTKP